MAGVATVFSFVQSTYQRAPYQSLLWRSCSAISTHPGTLCAVILAGLVRGRQQLSSPPAASALEALWQAWQRLSVSYRAHITGHLSASTLRDHSIFLMRSQYMYFLKKMYWICCRCTAHVSSTFLMNRGQRTLAVSGGGHNSIET